jgi:hypothetical protein
MPITHDEENLRFVFDDHWQVVRLDQCDFFRENLMPLQLTKSVDFLGLYRNNAAYLVEVKDYRGSRIELKNDEKMHAGDTLYLQVARKVKDSVACLVGAARMRQDAPWRGCANRMLAGGGCLRVVFWLEFNLGHKRRYRHAAHREADMKAEASTREKQLKQALSWLTRHVAVANQQVDPAVLPGTTVRDIARAGAR